MVYFLIFYVVVCLLHLAVTYQHFIPRFPKYSTKAVHLPLMRQKFIELEMGNKMELNSADFSYGQSISCLWRRIDL